MKTLIRILVSLLMVTIAPVSIVADNPPSKTITVKKVPKDTKDKGVDGYRGASRLIYCVIDMRDGIQPIDTSDIEAYEVWDVTDTTILASFGDEFEFISYVLGEHPQGIIKLCTPEYMYVGFLETSEN